MSRNADVGQLYAAALFELAKDFKQVEAVNDELLALAQVATGEKEFVELSTSPYFSQEYKEQLLQRLFAGTGELTMNFLQVVNRHNRMMHLPQIAQEYEKLRDAYVGCRLVQVTLAKAISESEIKKLADQIAATLESQVKLEAKVDESIIGGIIIRCGDMVVDNTVRRELREAVKAITSRRKNQETIQ